MDELVGRLKAGDAPARRAFFDAEADRVWRVCYRLVGDYDTAHDLVQETFIRAFARIDRYDGRGSLSGWLHRIALNLTRDAMRREKRRGRWLSRDDDGDVTRAAAPAADPDGDRRVRAALDALPEAMRFVVVMHDMEGWTHEEIGQALGIAAGSSRARLSRARQQLRESLAGTESTRNEKRETIGVRR